MARIAVSEPSAETRELIECLLARLHHEVAAPGERPDAILHEPGPRATAPEPLDAPLVIVSIYPPSPASEALGPVCHLMKPFTLAELERALERGLAARPAVAA